MENTGERHMLTDNFENEADYYIHLVHIATYNFGLKFIKGKKVLDYGCGSGYGSCLMAGIADQVVAVDISQEAIEFAKENYSAHNLKYKEISMLGNEKFDVITSFQVIEHVPNDKKYVKKLKRYLNSGGYLLISTPDKSNRLYNHIQKPWNIYHLKEYTERSLNQLLKKYFQNIEMLQIGSNSNFAAYEIARTQLQKKITLPCTLFIYPNFLRVFLLNSQTKAYKLFNKFRRKHKQVNKEEINQNFKSKYTIDNINIGKELNYYTELLVVCKKEKKIAVPNKVLCKA